MNALKSFFVLIAALIFIPSQAQEAVDGVYVREAPLRPKLPPRFELLYSFSELKDTASRAALIKEGYEMRDLFYEPPLKLDDCIYFNELLDVYFPAKKTGEQPLIKGLSQNSFAFSIATLTGAFRMYCDTSVIDKMSVQEKELISWREYQSNEIRSRVSIPFIDYARPFYLKKHEVTNGEYKEFVLWVRDSVARTILFDKGLMPNMIVMKDKNGREIRRLNWKEPIPWELPIDSVLKEMYLPEQERFYKRKEFDIRKFRYAFSHTRNDTAFESVNVYPDTLVWIYDFPYSVLEPYTNMYYWHPAYADYPVVGISYYQALAYLDWKTKRAQEKLDASNSKYQVRYELPNELQWEIAQIISKENKLDEKGYEYQMQLDRSWLTDLSLMNKDTVTYDVIPKDKPARMPGEMEWDWNRRRSTRSNFLIYNLQPNIHYKQVFDHRRKDGIFKRKEYKYGTVFIHEAEITLKYKFQRDNEWLAHNLDVNGISFMGGNVSEWMKESYAENWQPVLEKYKQYLKKFEGEDAELALMLISYYDNLNDKNGNLVRGANWWDTRHSYVYGKNQAGMNAKVFLDPSKARSTVGFRYIVRVTPKATEKK